MKLKRILPYTGLLGAIWLSMNLISAIGYGFFPLGAGYDVMHIVVTVLVVVTSIVSLVFFITAGFLDKKNQKIRLAANEALLAMMSGAILTNLASPEVFG